VGEALRLRRIEFVVVASEESTVGRLLEMSGIEGRIQRAADVAAATAGGGD
jgi:hypothetical protein